MRNKSLHVAVGIAFLGCGTPAPKPSIPTEQESIRMREEDDRAMLKRMVQMREDSIAREQQGIAFGSLRFGMTQQEVAAAKKTLLVNGYKLEIGTEDYMMYDFYTDEDKLYRIQIFDLAENASLLDTKVLRSARNLATVIEQKYGTPSTNEGVPEFFKYEPGSMQIMSEWSIGTKRILVGIVEKSTGAEYSAEAWIWDGPLQDAVRKKEETEKAAAQEKSASQF